MRFGILVILAVTAAACGGNGDGNGGDWSARAISESVQDAPVQPMLVGSGPALGPNRLSFAFFDSQGLTSSDVESASVRLYSLDDDGGGEAFDATLVSEHELTPVTLGRDIVHEHADGSLHTHESNATTVFVTSGELDRAEWWGAELSVTIDGKRTDGIRLRFWVLERTDEPMIGEQVPRSIQTVLRDVDDISEIDTSNPPNPGMHTLTVAEALDTGRPVVIAFATPAFCQTRFCGPVIDEVVRPLSERYRDRVEFVHIEPWDLAEAREGRLVPVPAMGEWQLPTEPVVFVVDGSGRVAAKFEGLMSFAEVDAAVAALLAGGSDVGDSSSYRY